MRQRLRGLAHADINGFASPSQTRGETTYECDYIHYATPEIDTRLNETNKRTDHNASPRKQPTVEAIVGRSRFSKPPQLLSSGSRQTMDDAEAERRRQHPAEPPPRTTHLRNPAFKRRRRTL
ncbi:hypothetical protein HPB51_022803 [Rhipicephalus microplus]|uniref:Uncharacterized protein n=1 Tax=Rhipicephalus microplus TaxID=6941 RepID=A0A9J6ECX9_RHIMP|nr:hypothetical protein HPB51_022803 [Rhipicephalus microplus]